MTLDSDLRTAHRWRRRLAAVIAAMNVIGSAYTSSWTMFWFLCFQAWLWTLVIVDSTKKLRREVADDSPRTGR